ncbi:hypothetical protein [Streptomyces sp. S1]|uniref:hypothetical protein n=1 Tax=Streptomyces sp. S1 TaxID=718288 RepID=UPI003D766122
MPPSPPVPPLPDPPPALGLLSTFLLQAEDALTSWDRYDAEYTDLDGRPYDQETYGAKQFERDFAIWRSFLSTHEAAELLDVAEASVAALSVGSAQPRWTWQLGRLQDALEEIETASADLDKRMAADPYMSGEDHYEAIAGFCLEVSNALSDWVTHGRAVLEIHAATVRAGQSGIRLAARAPHAFAPALPAPARRNR